MTFFISRMCRKRHQRHGQVGEDLEQQRREEERRAELRRKETEERAELRRKEDEERETGLCRP